MADVSKIKTLDGTTYNLKDATARGLLNGHSVGVNVPANAVFTDTTYGIATQSQAGLMSSADKTKLDNVVTALAHSPIVIIETASFSSLPQTVTSDLITADHYLLESTLGNPLAQTGDWAVNTTDGSLTVSGSISGSTTLKLILGKVISDSSTLLVYDIASFSSLPITVTDSKITPSHVMLHYELGNPSAQTGDWTVTTGTGQLQVAGSISGSTTLRVILGTADNL